MAYGYYRTGTVSTVAGSKTVTGSGVDFVTAKILPGARLFVSGLDLFEVVAKVTNASTLELADAAATTVTDAAYRLEKLYFEEDIASELSGVKVRLGEAIDVSGADRTLRLNADDDGDGMVYFGADGSSYANRFRQGVLASDPAKFVQQRFDGTTWRTIYSATTDGAYTEITAGSNDKNLFSKANPYAVAFTRTAVGTVSLKAGTVIELGGQIFTFVVDTAVQMPALAAGTDYAIYLCNDGVLQASADFSAPDGYTTATSRQIGGFHYAPGGNATAQAGGDATPQINEFSLWDLKWRPACADPRGMALVAGRFWADIYLTGIDVDVNGSSCYGVTIADGSSPPKIPTMFGGDGITTYGSFTQFEARELLMSVGKDLLDYGEFAAAAFGVTEAVSRGSDAVTTGLATTNAGSSNADQKFTSRWGLFQAAGCMWVWSRDLSGRIDGASFAAAATFAWHDEAKSRGQVYSAGVAGLAAARFGGEWGTGVNCGSRASHWGDPPWLSSADIGARGRCDHLFSI